MTTYQDNLAVVAIQDLSVGDWATFDPILGLEKIHDIQVIDTLNQSRIFKMYVGTGREIDGKTSPLRYIARFPYEPVPRVTMS